MAERWRVFKWGQNFWVQVRAFQWAQCSEEGPLAACWHHGQLLRFLLTFPGLVKTYLRASHMF